MIHPKHQVEGLFIPAPWVEKGASIDAESPEERRHGAKLGVKRGYSTWCLQERDENVEEEPVPLSHFCLTSGIRC